MESTLAMVARQLDSPMSNSLHWPSRATDTTFLPRSTMQTSLGPFHTDDKCKVFLVGIRNFLISDTVVMSRECDW